MCQPEAYRQNLNNKSIFVNSDVSYAGNKHHLQIGAALYISAPISTQIIAPAGFRREGKIPRLGLLVARAYVTCYQ